MAFDGQVTHGRCLDHLVTGLCTNKKVGHGGRVQNPNQLQNREQG